MSKLATAAVAATLVALTASQASAHERWFDMVNASNNAIISVHTKHTDRSTFPSRDLLGDAVLPPGYSMTVEPRQTQGYCRFDIQVDFDNGERQNILDVDLCRATQVITYGHLRDPLGDAVLPPGYCMTVEPRQTQGYCRFDIQVEFDNGERQNIRDVESLRQSRYACPISQSVHNIRCPQQSTSPHRNSYRKSNGIFSSVCAGAFSNSVSCVNVANWASVQLDSAGSMTNRSIL
jgi:hypothetical protein